MAYDKEYDELLEKAMKMPGIADLMELYSDIDKRVKEGRVWLKEEHYFATNSDSSSF
jgi:hypothetical protein